jgi:8-oxo-dGTP diphosphatase
MAHEGIYSYSFPRPAVTADCAIFGFDGGDLKILLIKRKNTSFYDAHWALPGGFLEENEDADAEACAKRELKEKTGIENMYIEQFFTFSNQKRDPRWVVSIAYLALVKLTDYQAKAGAYTSEVHWFPVNKIPLPLAFDHEIILKKAQEQLKRKIRYQPIGFELLPEKFTMPELHLLYETILQKDLDRRNFRKKILSMNLLIDHSEVRGGLPHKAPKIYSFDRKKYDELTEKGFNFEL